MTLKVAWSYSTVAWFGNGMSNQPYQLLDNCSRVRGSEGEGIAVTSSQEYGYALINLLLL